MNATQTAPPLLPSLGALAAWKRRAKLVPESADWRDELFVAANWEHGARQAAREGDRAAAADMLATAALVIQWAVEDGEI